MNRRINFGLFIVLLVMIVLLGSCSASARVKCGCPPRRSVVG